MTAPRKDCDHDARVPGVVIYQRDYRTNQMYVACGICRKEKVTEKRARFAVVTVEIPIPEYLLVAPVRPIPPAGVYLIPNDIRPTLMTVAADYDEAKRISDIEAVLDLIHRRNLPADETAELVSMLTETR